MNSSSLLSRSSTIVLQVQCIHIMVVCIKELTGSIRKILRSAPQGKSEPPKTRKNCFSLSSGALSLRSFLRPAISFKTIPCATHSDQVHDIKCFHRSTRLETHAMWPCFIGLLWSYNSDRRKLRNMSSFFFITAGRGSTVEVRAVGRLTWRILSYILNK